MHQQFVNHCTIDLTLIPDGPILIKSGKEGADPTKPDMEFVETYHAGGRSIYLPLSFLSGVILTYAMHIISRSRLVEFWNKHPDSKTSLLLWYKLTVNASWQNFVELREVFSSADQVGNFIVFNIGGNKFRLIVFIDFVYHKVFIRNVLTHAEYDKGQHPDLKVRGF